MEEEHNALYMPQGIKNRREYFEGYGAKEVRITVITVILAAVISYFTFMISGEQIVAVLLFLVIPTTTVLTIIRDSSNTSVIDQLCFMIRFRKSQKYYPYRMKKEI